MTKTIKDFPARYILLAWLFTLFFFPLNWVMSLFNYPSQWYWWEVGYYLSASAFLGLIFVSIGYYVKLNTNAFFGRSPTTEDLKNIGCIFVLLWVVSSAISYSIFYSLSFAFPEFVTWWYIELPPLIYVQDNTIPFLPNALNFISLVIIAPILEEVMFRGYLLHRWTKKWDALKALILSSVLFGIAHPDIVAATIFGMTMCVLYLRTQSLIIPILFHALWNFLVWLWYLYYLMDRGLDHTYTLKEFQSEWYYGLCYIIFSIILICTYLNLPKKNYVWRLPNA